MIYDCIMFNGEHECLETRIKELKGLPVMHIVIEGSHTFTGIPKTKFCSPDLLRIADNPYYYLVIGAESDNPWENEARQRNEAFNALHHVGCGNDDVVIISDCDEIPSVEAIERFLMFGEGHMKLVMDDFALYLNQRRGVQTWKRADILRYKNFNGRTPDQLRNQGGELLDSGGWHFSWLGGHDRIAKKFRDFSHQEAEIQAFNNPDIIAEKLKNKEYLFSDEKCEIVEINYDNLPRHIVDNQSKFKHLFYAG